MSISIRDKMYINLLRNSKYQMTRRVRERLFKIDERLKAFLGIEKYKKEYYEHMYFLSTSEADEKLSSLEKKYFQELVEDISNLTQYNLERGNIETTGKVIQAVIVHLRKREKKMDESLFGNSGTFFEEVCKIEYSSKVLIKK